MRSLERRLHPERQHVLLNREHFLDFLQTQPCRPGAAELGGLPPQGSPAEEARQEKRREGARGGAADASDDLAGFVKRGDGEDEDLATWQPRDGEGAGEWVVGVLRGVRQGSRVASVEWVVGVLRAQ